MPRHPDVNVDLTKIDGNAFAIMGAVIAAMKEAGLSNAQVEEYRKAATSGDYSHLLSVTIDFVDVGGGDEDELDSKMCPNGCGETRLWCEGSCEDFEPDEVEDWPTED